MLTTSTTVQIRQHISCGTACMHSSALLESQQRCSSRYRHHHCSSFPASWQGVPAICALVSTMVLAFLRVQRQQSFLITETVLKMRRGHVQVWALYLQMWPAFRHSFFV
jgi:hypothetical protein